MAVPKQHRSKSRQGQRRMHLYVKEAKFTLCKKCKKAALPHAVCTNCGYYNGRQVIDVLSKLDKKERKAREREMAAREQEAKTDKQEPLSPEQLSRPS